MPEIMTTKEVAEYLKLHPITILKYVGEGKVPAIRIGHVWRYDKDVIDKWIAEGQNIPVAGKETGKEQKRQPTGKTKRRKRNG